MKVSHVLCIKWPIPATVPLNYYSPGLIPRGNSLTLSSLPMSVPRSRLFCFRFFLPRRPFCSQRPLALDVVNFILGSHCEPCKRLHRKHFVQATSWERVLVSLRPSLCKRCTSYSVAVHSPLRLGKPHKLRVTL